jgi:hypothetical protein
MPPVQFWKRFGRRVFAGEGALALEWTNLLIR